MQFVCSSEGAANWPARGAAKPNVSPLIVSNVFVGHLVPQLLSNTVLSCVAQKCLQLEDHVTPIHRAGNVSCQKIGRDGTFGRSPQKSEQKFTNVNHKICE